MFFTDGQQIAEASVCLFGARQIRFWLPNHPISNQSVNEQTGILGTMIFACVSSMQILGARVPE
jgi:hypothetical protein